MLRLATCKDLIDLRGKHKVLDEQLRQAAIRHLTILQKEYDGDLVWGLKQMGTLFCVDKIIRLGAQTLLEAGAGLNTFFDQHFGTSHDYWMVDSSGFYETQSFSRNIQCRKHTTFVDGLLGEFSSQLPENHFDAIFSISVLEHAPFDKLKGIFQDIYRLLKPGGYSFHTIDVNPHSPAANKQQLVEIIEAAGFEFEVPPCELDWDVSKIREPLLLEPLRIVYEYYYKKSVKDWPTDPYLTCYHFGSILLSVQKPLRTYQTGKTTNTLQVQNHAAVPLQEHIRSYCSLIDETFSCSSASPVKLADSYRDIQLGKYFRTIRQMLQQDSTLVYKDESLRNFLYRTFPFNPLIPKEIAGTPCNQIVPIFDEVTDDFIVAVRRSPLPITVTSFQPDLSAYRTFLEKHAHLYESRFGTNHLHGDRYFFEKTLEHFITFFLIQQCQPHDIMDIGSAGHQYANIIRKSYPGARVYAQDLCFPAGTRDLAENFIQIGGSAASLPLQDASLDFVTFHCSIEHFEGDADIRCLQEIERVLRSGGCAVIVPLHVNTEYTIAVNPLSGPFLDEAFIDKVLLPEWREHDAHIIYTDSMISRFARRYSAEVLTGRLLLKLTKMRFELATIEIPDKFMTEEILSGNYFHGAYRKYIPHDRRCFLKLIKQ